MQLGKSFWSFCAKIPHYFPHSPKRVKKLWIFRRKNSPIKNLHWTQRMKFRQTYHQIFAKSPRCCVRRPKRKQSFKDFVLRKILFQKYPLDTWKQFENPTRLISPKIQNVFFKHWKKLKNLKSFWKRKFSLQKCPPYTKKTVLTIMSIKFTKIPNIFPQSPLVGVKLLEENDNVSKKILWTSVESSFPNRETRFPTDVRRVLSSKLEKNVNVNIFFRKQTFLEKCVVQVECTFVWQLLSNFCANVQNVLPTVGKQQRNSKKS